MLDRLLARVRDTDDGKDLARLRETVKERDRELEVARERIEKQRHTIAKKDRRISRLKQKIASVDREAAENSKARPIFGEASKPATGVLPDFLIIGAQKCGTTFLYNLLTEYPYVSRASTKEVHFFSRHFDRGIDWYRSHFPPLADNEARRVITGEASPFYLFHPHAARRAAATVPRAKLIVLLRNPVDRAYSHYHHQLRMGHETLPTFEEAIEAEESRLQGEKDRMLANEHYASLNYPRFSYLSRGVYVDQLPEWYRLFGGDRVLVLKSEDFFDRPLANLKRVMRFLDLPEWEPETVKVRSKRYSYTQMNLVTRQRLSDYFEPHNRKLYEFLGSDFGW